MSKTKYKKATPEQQKYQQFAKEREPQRPLVANIIRAFISGGLICTFGQGIQWFFMNYYNFSEETAGSPTVAVLIFISMLLTGFGVYDHLAQWCGAGTIIPVTGFANTMTSAAIEHRSEGYVLGVGGNMFKLAGSVIVYGVFSAFVVVNIKLLVQWLGGM